MIELAGVEKVYRTGRVEQVPSRNRAAVIAFPGRDGPIAHARMLARHGYGVLLFDRRGEGESDGDFNAFGWGGDADVKAAVSFLASRDDVYPARIGGLGLSVGGELLLEAAAEDARLRAVVSEGAGVRSLAEHWDDPGPARGRSRSRTGPSRPSPWRCSPIRRHRPA